jgi:nitrate reductase NapD
MNLSGILVIVTPDHFETSVESLNELPGVEVHHTDVATGRIVIVQEAENVGAEVEGLKRIKQLPHVTVAEMVYHYCAEDDHVLELQSEDIEQLSKQVNVPAYLNN